MLPPRSFAARNSLPPEGAAAPTDWQSQIRGPCLNKKLYLGSLKKPVALADSLLVSFQTRDAEPALPGRRRAAPSGGRALHAVNNRGGNILA